MDTERAAPAVVAQPERSIAAIVLAGGRSSRMGADKALAQLCGRTLLERAVELVATVATEVIVVGSPARRAYRFPDAAPVRFIRDAAPWGGPLVGLIHGLRSARTPVVLAVGCDMPLLEPALLQLLCERTRHGAGVVIPRPGGQPQPLCAAWTRDALPALEAAVAAGERSVIGAARRVGIRWVEDGDCARLDPGGRSFLSVDTPEDLLEARRALCAPTEAGDGGGESATQSDEVLRSAE